MLICPVQKIKVWEHMSVIMKKSIFKFRWFLCWSSLCQFVKRLQTIRYGSDALTLIRLCVSSAGPKVGGGG